MKSISFRKPRSAAGLVVAAGFAMCSCLQAITIVETGLPTGGPVDWGLQSSQWLAGAFDVEETIALTGVEGFIRGTGGAVTIALYQDGGGLPGVEIYSASFDGGGLNGWSGVSGLNWVIGPGSYWVGFEVRAGSTFIGVMPGNPPNPLPREAVYSGGRWIWVQQLDLGIRILGDPSEGMKVSDGGSTLGFAALSMLGMGLFSRSRAGRRPLKPARGGP